MHPPVSACEALYNLHPQLRLAWAGRPKKNDEDENPGSFAVVQLYHISDVGRVDDAHTFREMWDTTIWYDDYGRATTIRANRGPIFNRYGGTDRDWDPLFRIPVFVCTLDEQYGTSIYEVFSGSYIRHVKRWLRPYYERFEESSKEKAARYRARVDDMGREASDVLWHKANKTGEAYAQNWSNSPTETRNMRRKRRGELEPENWLLPKHAEVQKEGLMNRSELISKIKFYINMNDGQTDQDLTDVRLIELLNDKYKELVVRAKQEGLRTHFQRMLEDTWEASETTYSLPSNIRDKDILRIMDVTAGAPGVGIDIAATGAQAAITWQTTSTLYWAPVGPASDVDLQIFYLASAEELLSDEAEPSLIPPEHQTLLVWATAIEYRIIADDQVPDGWMGRFNELEANWHKSLSRGKPWDNEPWVRPRDSDQSGEGNL